MALLRRVRSQLLSTASLARGLAALTLLCLACGAPEERAPEPVPAENEAEPVEETGAEAQEATPEPEPEPAEPEPEPEPEPIAVVAGTSIGPISIGMTEEALGELGLERTEVDPRSARFGPYVVRLRDGAVRRVESTFGELEHVQIGTHRFDVGVDIHEIRDALGDCRWIEGGGERYRCADGTLWIQTTHSMDPTRYLIAVEAR